MKTSSTTSLGRIARLRKEEVRRHVFMRRPEPSSGGVRMDFWDEPFEDDARVEHEHSPGVPVLSEEGGAEVASGGPLTAFKKVRGTFPVGRLPRFEVR